MSNAALPGEGLANQAIANPCMGLYLDRPSHTIDPRGLEACNNVRIELGRIRNDLMGWNQFGSFTLNGPVTLLDTFQASVGAEQLILGTPTDLYNYNGGTPVYITPAYTAGTLQVQRYTVATAVPHSGNLGTGYAVGDLLAGSGGTAAEQPTFQVLTIGAAGALATLAVVTPGGFSAKPSNPVTLTTVTGGGSSGKADYTYQAFSVMIGTGTFWKTPIGGNSTAVLSANVAVGSTALPVNIVPASLTVGTLVADSSDFAIVQVGSIVTGINGTVVTISKPLAFAATAGDVIRFGGQLANFRTNIRAGDQIYVTSSAQNSTTAAWVTVLSVTDNTHLAITTDFGSSTASGQAYTNRQCAVNWDLSPGAPFGAYSNHWESENFPQAGAPYNKDMWFATNGADPLVAWDGASLFAAYVTTVPFISTTIRRAKNLMLYGGLIGSNGQLLPTSFASSDNSLPTIMAGGVAFQGQASDGPYVLNHIGVLGSVVMLYMNGPTGGSVVSASFIGTPSIWAFSEVIRGRGPVSGRLVAEFPDRHQFITTDGMYRYNGLFIQVMNDQVWRAVMKNFDRSRADRAFSLINQTYGDIQWAVPLQTDTGGNPDFPSTRPLGTAYTEHYMEQANSFLFKPYTQRDFPFSVAAVFPNVAGWTWNNDGQAFSADPFPIFQNVVVPATVPLTLAGDVNGQVWQLYQSAGAGMNGMSSWVRYPKRVLGNGRSRVLVKRVYPMIEPVTSPAYKVSVILSLSDAIGGPTNINDTQQFDPGYGASSDGTVFRYTKHWRRGRVAQLTIGTQGCSGYEPFIVDGYDWDFVDGGFR